MLHSFIYTKVVLARQSYKCYVTIKVLVDIITFNVRTLNLTTDTFYWK